MVVISTTILSMGYSPKAAALPTSLTLDDALAVVSPKGYDAVDYANENVPDEATWEATTLGVRTPSDRYDQRAFFFLGDPIGGSATVRYYWNGRRLVPKDPVPPAAWDARLSRREGLPVLGQSNRNNALAPL